MWTRPPWLSLAMFTYPHHVPFPAVHLQDLFCLRYSLDKLLLTRLTIPLDGESPLGVMIIGVLLMLFLFCGVTSH